ncbi:MAG: hypothetical protein U1E35_00380 [Rhodospirillales bacterium]
MTTRSTRPLNDDDRRAAALAAVIVNDTTLLSEHNGDLSALVKERTKVWKDLSEAVSCIVRRSTTRLAYMVRRVMHAQRRTEHSA